MKECDLTDDDLICFKYRTLEQAARCLNEGSLYFAKPDELNDMLEAKFDDSTPDEHVVILEHVISRIREERGESPVRFDRTAMPELISHLAREDIRLRNFCNGLGIFSATQTPHHQALWAYYADNYQGVCFETHWSSAVIAANQLVCVNVIYDDQPRVLNKANHLGAILKQLANKHPQLTTDDLWKLAMKEEHLRRLGIEMASIAASIKHTDWAHEKEIRILTPKGGRAVPILADVLKRVHFVNTSSCRTQKWAEIMLYLRRHYPSVDVVEWRFDHGQISKISREMEFRKLIA